MEAVKSRSVQAPCAAGGDSHGLEYRLALAKRLATTNSPNHFVGHHRYPDWRWNRGRALANAFLSRCYSSLVQYPDPEPFTKRLTIDYFYDSHAPQFTMESLSEKHRQSAPGLADVHHHRGSPLALASRYASWRRSPPVGTPPQGEARRWRTASHDEPKMSPTERAALV